MTIYGDEHDSAGGESRFVFRTREIAGPIYRYTDATTDQTVDCSGRVMLWVALDISDASSDYGRFEIMRTLAHQAIDWAEARAATGTLVDFTIADFDSSDTWIGRNDIEADDIQVLRDRLNSLNPSNTSVDFAGSLVGAKANFDRVRDRDHAIFLYLSSGEGDESTLPAARVAMSEWMEGKYPNVPTVIPVSVQNADTSNLRHMTLNTPEPRLVVEGADELDIHNMLSYLTPTEKVFLSHPVHISSGLDNSGGVEFTKEVSIKVSERSALVQNFFGDDDFQNVLVEVHRKRARQDTEFSLDWAGRVLRVEPDSLDGSATVKATAFGDALDRPGLRRASQYRCPHILYGDGCRASLRSARVLVSVSPTLPGSATVIRLPSGALTTPTEYYGGLCWWFDSGRKRIRNIRSVEDGRTLILDGDTQGLASAGEVFVAKGCPKTVEFCRDKHKETGTQKANVLNYGGFESIPIDNPHAFRSVFY